MAHYNIGLLYLLTYKTNSNCNLNEFHNWNNTASQQTSPVVKVGDALGLVAYSVFLFGCATMLSLCCALSSLTTVRYRRGLSFVKGWIGLHWLHVLKSCVEVITSKHRLRIREYRFQNSLKFTNFTKFLKFVKIREFIKFAFSIYASKRDGTLLKYCNALLLLRYRPSLHSSTP